MNKIVFFGIIFFLFLMRFSFAATITLNESNGGNVGDAYVASSSTTMNAGKSTTIYIQTDSSNTERIFILWSLSGIPAGSTITNANLSLYMLSAPSASQRYGAYNTSIYNSTGGGPWVEGNLNGANCAGAGCDLTRNITWANQPAAGTLQDTAISGTSSAVWLYWNVTNAAITAYANATNKNMSIMIKNITEGSTTRTGTFYSKEDTHSSNTLRPQLVITYKIVATPPTYSGNQTNTTWNGVPANFSLNWNSNVGLSGYIFSTNNSGTWTNSSFITFTGLSNVSWNVTTLNSTIGSLVQWKFYANDTSNNWNTSLTYNLTVTAFSYPQISNVGESMSTIAPNGTVTLYAQGMDTYSLDWTILSTNESGSWQNKSWYAPLNLNSYTSWYGNNTIDNSVYAEDLNGDGKLEILTLGNYYNFTDDNTYAQLRIWNYTATSAISGTLDVIVEKDWTSGGQAYGYSVVVDDLNHDGHKKIITVGVAGGDWNNADLRIWNYTDGTINLETVKDWYTTNVTNTTSAWSVTTNDINGDGHDEIVTAGMLNESWNPQPAYISQLRVWNYTNNAINLIASTEWYTGGRTEAQSVRVGDLAGDGTKKIVVGGLSTGGARYQAEVSIFNLTNNVLMLENRTDWHGLNDTIVYSVAIGDVNNDGVPELVTGGLEKNDMIRRAAQLRIWNYSNKQLNLKDDEVWYVPNGGDSEIYSVVINDINKDGIPEIVTAGLSNNEYGPGNIDRGQVRIWTYVNNVLSLKKENLWSDGIGVLEGELDDSLKVADLNNDGINEIITGGRTEGNPNYGILRVYSVGNIYGSPMNLTKIANTWLWSNFTWRNTSLTSGVVGWRIYYNNTYGNWNVTDIKTFSISNTNPDTTPPTVTIQSPNNTTYSNATIALNFTTVDIGSGVDLTKCAYKIDVGIMTSIPSCVNITLPAMANGSHTLIVYSNDNAGNQGNASVSFTVNTTVPVTTGHLIVNKVTNPSNNTTILFSITASGTGNVTAPANATITGNSSHNYEVTSGTYNVTENSVFGWNQTSNNCTNVVVAVGQNINCTITNTQILVAPIISIVSPADGSIVTQNSVLLNVSTDKNAVCKYDSKDVSYDLMSNMFNFTNSTLHTSYLSNLQDGIYVLYIRCKDDYGNANQESKKISFMVNTHLSALTIISVNTGTYQTNESVILNITTNNNSYCRYSNQGVGYDYMNDQFTNGEGATLHWTSVNSQEGINVFYASCSDTSGSSMTTATPILFSVDTSNNYNITIPLKQWWNSFLLSRIILEKIDSLKGNYTVTNVLSSIESNYQILYYYNGTFWTSYVPGRPAGLNDLTEFNDQSNLPYWINMLLADRIEIP